MKALVLVVGSLLLLCGGLSGALVVWSGVLPLRPPLTEQQIAARARTLVEAEFVGEITHITPVWKPTTAVFGTTCRWQDIVAGTIDDERRAWNPCALRPSFWSVQVSGTFAPVNRSTPDQMYVELLPDGTHLTTWAIDDLVYRVPPGLRHLFLQCCPVIPGAQ